MLSRALRLALALGTVSLFGCTLLFSLEDHASVGGGSDSAMGDSRPLVDGAVDGDIEGGGPIEITFVPPLAELKPGTAQSIHVILHPLEPVSGPMTVQFAPQVVDGALAPVSVDKPSITVPTELPEGDIELRLAPTAHHGLYGVSVVATGIDAKSGNPLSSRTTLKFRAVGKPGTLDTGFGNGTGYTDFCPVSGSNCQPGGFLVYPDDRFLVSGSVFAVGGGGYKLLLARFKPDGTLDTTFSGTGWVVLTIPGVFSVSNVKPVFLPDGSLLVGFSDGRFAAVHVSDKGELDRQFGVDGVVHATDISNGASTTVPRNGAFLTSGQGNPSVGLLRRYLLDGGPDPSFNGGTRTYSINSSTNFKNVMIDESGRIVVAGYAANTGNYFPFVMRLLPDGTPDGTFSGTGSVDGGPGVSFIQQPTSSTQEELAFINRHGVGYVTAGFYAISGYRAMAVYRMQDNGRIDQTFNKGTGRVLLDPGYAAEPVDLLVESNQSILVAQANSPNVYVVRFTSSGETDTTFGTNGVCDPVPGRAQALATVEAGRQLIVAAYIEPEPRPIRIVRYWLR
jgi:uncharacterized delta-60 repeat protein